jgi:RNA polymerase sigma-70 factor (ECF subfamily)
MLRIPDCDAVRSPEAYLFTVARHVVIQHSIRQSHLQFSGDSPAALERLVDPDPDPVEQISAQESLRELNSAYRQLGPREQATLCYHMRDGLTMKEIAGRLGVTRQMVKKYLEKAVLKMRHQLQGIR